MAARRHTPRGAPRIPALTPGAYPAALAPSAYPATPTSAQTSALSPGVRWRLSCNRRPHTHDVRALAVGDPEAGSGGGPVLVSAGTDTQLCTLQLHDFERCA